MTTVNTNTKQAQAIIDDFGRAGKGTIYQAYATPSNRKIQEWLKIERRACQTAGYNHDLRVSGAGSHHFSTIYSYNEGGHTVIVKDTKSNTFKVVL